jgi:tetratricopeptide (TPR) repeat protein
MRVRSLRALACIVVVGALAGGCDEISARRKMQEANDQYKNGRYEEARDLFEEALKKSPGLAVGHHNLGVTYYKLMKRGDDSAENKLIADNAAKHLEIYLESNPDDDDIRKLITDIWVDTGQVDKAIGFWTERHDAVPDNIFPIEQLAELTFKKGDWREAIRWLEVGVDVAKTPEQKTTAYTKIGSLCFVLLLNNKEPGPSQIDGALRVEVADLGIAALQKGQAISPSSTEIVSVLGSLNVQRGIASGSRLGYSIDMAAYQNYMRIFGVLREEAQKAQPKDAEEPSGQGS